MEPILKETKTLKAFRWIAILEGISFIAFFITMPLKYFMEMPTPNKYVGMTHGILFIIYVLVAFLVTKEQNWKLKSFGILFLASLIPFATFYVERKYLKAH